jgi:hypothetical protein
MKHIISLLAVLFCLVGSAFGQATPSFFYPVDGAYVNAVGDSLIYYERTDGTDSIIVVISQNGIYFRVHVADSLLLTRQTIKVLIEDSLNEYSLTSAIAAAYETITNVAKIGDDTTTWKAVATQAATDSSKWRVPEAAALTNLTATAPLYKASAGVVACSTATATLRGVAKFNTDNFAVTSGDVTLKSGGVNTDEVLNGTITEPDLNITNAPTGLDNYLLSLNEAGGNFTWVASGGGGETNTLGDTGTFNGTEGFGLAGGKTGTVLKVKGLIEGTNITIAASGDSAYTITASGGSGAWDEIDGATRDTVRWIDPAGDTSLVITSDGAGNVMLTVGKESDNTAQTLRIKMDTLDISGDVIADFAGTALSVTSGVLNVTIPAQGDSVAWSNAKDSVAAWDNGVLDSTNMIADGLSVSGDLHACTSAELAGVLSDETGGTAKVVFNASPDFTGTITADSGTFNGNVDIDSMDVVGAADFTGTVTVGTLAGTIDAGGATSFEFPNSDNPTVSANGQAAWENDDNCWRMFDGTNNRAIPTMHYFSATLALPKNLYDSLAVWTIFPVRGGVAPFGIHIDSLWIETDNSSTYSVIFEEWSAPQTKTNDIDTIATSTSYTAAGVPSDADIATGGRIKVRLPATTGTKELIVGGSYYIKTGD